MSSESMDNQARKPLSPGGLMPFSFPSTRAALWNKKPTAQATLMHISQYRNPTVVLEEKTLRLAHRFSQESGKECFACFLDGSVSADPDGEGVTITIDRFDPGRDLSVGGSMSPVTNVPGEICIPFMLTTEGKGEDKNPEEYVNMIKLLHQRCGSKDRVELGQFMALRAHGRYYRNTQNYIFHLHFDMVTLATQLKATPINHVPIVPTALSKNLAGPLNVSEIQGEPKTGFLTMDHTRKLLLVLESDPKVYSLPLVGIWLSGVANIHDPFVWASCLRYIHSIHLQDRVCVPPEAFLVVLYSPLHSKPEFYEMVTSDNKTQLQFELSSCHEVVQLSQDSPPRPQSPLEIELTAVESGHKKNLFDCALQRCRDFRDVKPQQSESSSSAVQFDDMMPRTSPSPHHAKVSMIKPSVPEVSLIFDDHSPAGSPATTEELHEHDGHLPSSQHEPQRPLKSALKKTVIHQPVLERDQTPPRGPLKPLNRDSMSNPASPNVAKPSLVDAYGIGHSQGMPNVDHVFDENTGRYVPLRELKGLKSMHANGAVVNSIQAPGVQECTPVMSGQAQVYPLPRSGHAGVPQCGYAEQQFGMTHPSLMYHSIQTGPPNQQNMQYQTARYMCPQNQMNQWVGQHAQNGVYGDIPQPHYYVPQPMHRQAGLSKSGGVPQVPFIGNYGYPNMVPKPALSRGYVSPVSRSGMQKTQAPTQTVYSISGGHSVQGMPYVNCPPSEYQPPPHVSRLQQPTRTTALYSEQNLAEATSVATSIARHPNTQYSQSSITAPPSGAESHSQTVKTQLEKPKSSEFAHTTQSSTKLLATQHPEQRTDNVVAGPHMDCPNDNVAEQVVPPGTDVYKLLQQQDNQLRELRAQLAQLLAKQSESPSVPADNVQPMPVKEIKSTGTQSSAVSSPLRTGKPSSAATLCDAKQTCSVAVNTSIWWPKSNEEPCEVGKTTGTTVQYDQSKDQQVARDTVTSSPKGGESDTGIASESTDTLSLGELHLTQQLQDDKASESLVSDMVVDMPAYTSISPDRMGNERDTDDSDQSPMLGESISMYQELERGWPNHTEEAGESGLGDSQDVDLLFSNQKQFYEKLIGNVKKFLHKHGAELEEEGNDISGSNQNNSQPTIFEDISVQERDPADQSVDVAAQTVRQLEKMGINLSVPNSPQKSFRFHDGSILFDPKFLPRINYVSMMLDSDTDLSADADALAMKYLSDEQLSELAKLQVSNSTGRHTKHNVGLSRLLSTGSQSRDVSIYGMHNNNLTLSTRKYMETYGLVEPAKQNDKSRMDSGGESQDSSMSEPGILNVKQFLQKLAEKSFQENSTPLREPERPDCIIQQRRERGRKDTSDNPGIPQVNFQNHVDNGGGSYLDMSSIPHCSGHESSSDSSTGARDLQATLGGRHHQRAASDHTPVKAHRSRRQCYDGHCSGHSTQSDQSPVRVFNRMHEKRLNYSDDAEHHNRRPHHYEYGSPRHALNNPKEPIQGSPRRVSDPSNAQSMGKVLDIERLKELPKLL